MARPAARAQPPGGAAASCAPGGVGPPRVVQPPCVQPEGHCPWGQALPGGRCVLPHGRMPGASVCHREEWGCRDGRDVKNKDN